MRCTHGVSAGTTIAESRLPLPEIDLDRDGDTDVVVYHLNGPWFFGAAARLGSVLERIADRPRQFVVVVSEVPMVDSSGARSFLLLARRMVERGVRFVQIYHNNWDMHANAAGRLPSQCRDLDQGAYGLINDLKQRGMLDDTLVVWGGEFGRTPMSQGGDGRDHHIN